MPPARAHHKGYIARVPEPSESPGFPPGTLLLDKYRVVRELGVGGMSVVVCAEHVTLGTKVAMKFLLPELAKLPDAPKRFVQEARAGSKIPGEHVAGVLDVGALPDGRPYMVMEYLEGKDLGRYVKGGTRFAVQDAIDYVVQAAEALSRAHAAGVIHRDVKPSNLFLTRRADGTALVKVLDFGISKVIEEASKESLQLTKTNAVMGSALYMSLEQMYSAKAVDHRTDIYALGVSLYELLAGTHPYTADSFSQLCVKVSLDPPEPLRKHRPDVPEELAAVIAVAYARNAPDRYATVGRFAAALEPFASADTKRLIDAIRSFERSSPPDEDLLVQQMIPPGLRVTDVERPPLPRWPLYAVAAGAGVALTAALALAIFWNPGAPTNGTTSGAGAPDAAVSTTTLASADPSGGQVVPVVSVVVPVTTAPVTSASTTPDVGKPGKSPCTPGQVSYEDPKFPGMRRPCSLWKP
jgi:serine/threonine protein kinase